MTDSPEEEEALEMDLEAYREDMKMEDPHKYYTMYAVVRSRCKQLIEGRGGIMEMKQTIAEKEHEIEELKAALRKCHTALEVAFDYDGDDVFGMMHNDAVDASMEAERLLGIK